MSVICLLIVVYWSDNVYFTCTVAVPVLMSILGPLAVLFSLVSDR